MKRIFALLLSLIMIFSFGACSKASDIKEEETEAATEVPTSAKDLVYGTWQKDKYAFIFNEDGTGTYKYGDNEMTFTFSATDADITITYESGSVATFKYTIKDKTLKVEDTFGNIIEYTKK